MKNHLPIPSEQGSAFLEQEEVIEALNNFMHSINKYGHELQGLVVDGETIPFYMGPVKVTYRDGEQRQSSSLE